ncbi:MAG: DUF4367 domain-containing protein [Clostridia bacterium]|nr:DUF4367 domain-containing protein [Clostridia bacterium]
MKQYQPDMEEIKDEYLDAVLRVVFRLQEEAQIQALVEQSKWEQTEEEKARAREEWQRIVEKYEKLQKEKMRAERRRRLGTVLRKTAVSAACILLVALIGTSIAVAAVKPVRQYAIRMLMSFEDGHVDVRLVQTEEAGGNENEILPETMAAEIQMPEGWRGNWFPSYIPEGYKIRYMGSNGLHVTYENEGGHSLDLYELHENDGLGIDTSEVKVYTVELPGGKTALVTEAEGYCAAVWSEEDAFFMITSEEPLGEVTRIIESMRRIR